ncbi:MAG: tetratricopeptide repeat protein [Planctomycetia bacterium]|nr:tetratricopeptide repeat protein [Planctomycetia bacterium]
MLKRFSTIAALAVCIVVVGCESQAQKFNKLGLDAYSRGDYRNALGAFSLAVEKDPVIADYYFNRGACYQAIGDLHRALDDYKMSTSLGPGIIAAWEQMADCYLAMERPEEALKILKRACDANPYTARPFIAVANFYLGRGDHEMTEIWLAKAVARDPENADAHRRYGRFLLRIGKQEQGLREYRKSLQLDPVQPYLSEETTTIAPSGDQLPPPKPVTE